MMDCNNGTIKEFLLTGISGLGTSKTILFILFLVKYFLTVTINLLIIGLFLLVHSIQSPMYFFLSHLALSDILLSTNVSPVLLLALLKDGATMSVSGCLNQLYLVGSFTIAESYLLTVMSYDRYLAICNPLRYMKMMDHNLRLQLASWSWILAFLLSLIYIIQMYFFQFCGCNIVDHVFCDFDPLLQMSCTDTTILEIQIVVFSVPIVLFPFVFITTTYIMISLAILKITSTTSRMKTFSTCSSHLIVVCTYYGILIAKYTVPTSGHSTNMKKMISLLYTVFTPLLNPIIYSLRNQDIRGALHTWLSISRIQLRNMGHSHGG